MSETSMNWFKKKFKKILNRDDYEYEEYDQYEDYEEEYEEQSNYRQPLSELSASKQKTFRFPLIDDKANMPQAVQSRDAFDQVDHFYGQIEDLSLPKHLDHRIVDASVYDVEVSGIRELLEKRSKRTGRTTVTRSQPQQEYMTKASMVFRDAQTDAVSVQKKSTVKQENTVENSIPQNRKRFVPTDVPSPVYGFAKPSPIEQLLNKRKEEQEAETSSMTMFTKEATTNEPIANILEEQEPFNASNDVREQLEKSGNMVETLKRSSVVEKVETGGQQQSTDKVNKEAITKQAIMFEEVEASGQQQSPDKVNKEAITKQAIMFEEVEASRQQQSTDKVNREAITKQAIMFEEVEASGQQQSLDKVNGEAITKQAIILEEVAACEQSQSTMALSAPQTTSHAVHFEEQLKETVQQELAVEQLSADQSTIHVKDVVVEQLQIENSTIHIGEVTVVQPTNEENEQEITEELSLKQEKSRIPFNVLMLKSDKEKWRIAQHLKSLSPATVTEQEKQKEKALTSNHDKTVTLSEGKTTSLPTVNVETEVFNPVPSSSEAEAENISVITVSPVATMTRVPTEEQTTIEAETMAEISATIVAEHDSLRVKHIEETSDAQSVEKTTETGKADVSNALIVSDVKPLEKEAKLQKPIHVYQKPTVEFLEPPEEKTQDTEWMEQQGDTLVEALSYFQVSAQIESIMQGPAVTQFEITVSHGTKVSKIRNLADDLKLALAAKDIRIQAPIPGKSSIGIEIPNRVSRAVRLSEVTNSASFLDSDSPLEAALGLDLTGKPVTIDLRKMPHGLIAGATGSGKSVCINSILVSLLYKAAPHELKLMLIDPKMVELAPFNHIPHLVSPVITDVKAATAALKWAVEEMERRYQLFAHAGARDITRYNALADKNNEHSLKLPYILIVIDELADLMMMSPADVEEAICRIAQKARACGIHLIVATQRPSVDVITGLIKSNIPTRIAFAVSSQIDSRTILDGQGAERLLGRGDMLYLGNGMSAPVRLQGTFVTDDEIEAIIDHVREQGDPDYIFDQEELLKKSEISSEQDDLFEDVCRFVYEQGGASTSLIQRKYHIGYNRAARLIDMLESHGFVSEARGSKPRESYITEQDLIAMFE